MPRKLRLFGNDNAAPRVLLRTGATASFARTGVLAALATLSKCNWPNQYALRNSLGELRAGVTAVL